MKKTILLILILVLVSPLLAQQEITEKEKTLEVVFESTLKDIDCIVVWRGEKRMGVDIHWILKFENGAIIRTVKYVKSGSKKDVWWIDKKYVVLKKTKGTIIRLIK